MHHPDICQILLTLDDYFILSDSERHTAQIYTLIENSKDRPYRQGIKIKQDLFNGYMEIDIISENKDNNELIFHYFLHNSSLKDPQETFKVDCGDYTENIRRVFRKILAIDKDNN